MMLAETSKVDLYNGNQKKNGFSLVGRSRAGDATAFCIPQLKWLFDCGAMVLSATPRSIFLSHTHSDHVHFLSHYFVKNDAEKPPTVYLPEESLEFVKAHLQAYQTMVDCGMEDDASKQQKLDLDRYLIPLKPNQDFILSQPGNEFRIRTLQMHHRIPCLGYSIAKINSKLKEEYVGLQGKEIAQLKRDGIDITTETEEPFLCFMGDTTAKVFEYHPDICQQHSTIVIECSFLDLPNKAAAERTMHMHWDDLQKLVASHPDTMFLLTHFSLKYSTLRIRQFFQDMQRTYDNVHPMLVEREVEELWIKSGEEGDVPRCQCRICRQDSS